MTNRTSGSLDSQTGTQNVLDPNGNFWWSHSWPAPAESQQWVTAGVNTPQYHRRLREGRILPLNTYSSVKQEIVEASGSCNVTGQNGWFDQCKFVFPGSYPHPAGTHGVWQPSLGDLERWRNGINPDVLLQAAASKLAADFDALTFLAEAKQLKGLVVRSLWRLIELLKSDISRFSKISKVAQSAPGWWLEYRYGVRPLIGDIKAINDIIKRQSRVRQIISVSKNSAVAFEETTPASFDSQGIWLADGYLHHLVTVSRRAVVVADYVKPDFKFNLFATAWELIPYSFVIDWLVNVGMAIDAVTMRITANPSASIGTFMEVTTTKQLNGWGNPPYATGEWSSRTVWRHTEKVRLPASIPVLPAFNLRLDGYKIADLAAMAYQLLKHVKLN